MSSPCKIYYSIKDSQWIEGGDINLMNLDHAPLNIAVSILEVGISVELS